jgi:hypothetical protein
VKVVECGDGGGEVALGRVQLLNVPGDLLHHALALTSLVFYVPVDAVTDGRSGLKNTLPGTSGQNVTA